MVAVSLPSAALVAAKHWMTLTMPLRAGFPLCMSSGLQQLGKLYLECWHAGHGVLDRQSQASLLLVLCEDHLDVINGDLNEAQ